MSRGMKKFLPFQSLKEQALALLKMQEEAKKVDKPLISDDTKEAINALLLTYNGENVRIIYYEKGFILSLVTTIKKIDTYNQILVLSAKKIMFTNVLNIELFDFSA